MKGSNEDRGHVDIAVSEEPAVEKTADVTSNVDAPSDQSHSERVAETLANAEELLSEANENLASASSLASEWSQALEKTQNHITEQLQKFNQSFEKQLHDLQQTILENLSRSTEKNSEPDTQQDNETPVANASKQPESDWERRKREMYAEFGEPLPEHEEKPPLAAVEQTGEDELASLQESLHDSIESLDEVQAEQIEDLRAQLTEKLREAEVELSINRAKLDQRRAELERRQNELERREKSLASKYSSVDVDGTPQKLGVLDRLTRHLGVRKQADSL